MRQEILLLLMLVAVLLLSLPQRRTKQSTIMFKQILMTGNL